VPYRVHDVVCNCYGTLGIVHWQSNQATPCSNKVAMKVEPPKVKPEDGEAMQSRLSL